MAELAYKLLNELSTWQHSPELFILSELNLVRKVEDRSFKTVNLFIFKKPFAWI